MANATSDAEDGKLWPPPSGKAFHRCVDRGGSQSEYDPMTV